MIVLPYAEESTTTR